MVLWKQVGRESEREHLWFSLEEEINGLKMFSSVIIINPESISFFSLPLPVGSSVRQHIGLSKF